MSNNYMSNTRKENILKFIFSNWSIWVVTLSFSGFIYIFMYLNTIDRLEIFTQITFYSHVVFAIVLYFSLLFCLFGFLPFVFWILLWNSARDNDGFVKFVEGNKALYTVLQPISILTFLVVFFLFRFDELDNESKGYVLYFFIILYFLIVFCFLSFNYDTVIKCKRVILFYSSFYSLLGVFFISIISIFAKVSNGDDFLFFIVILLCLFFLMFANYVSIDIYNLGFKKYLAFLCVIYILLFISLSAVGNKFELQRIVLKPIGIAQTPSQSGGYLLKNGDFLELIERNKFEKYMNTIDGRTYIYVHGYLILNVGDVRVICPHDFETGDNQRSNNQKLDFSRCLSLTSEDIKFMKKGFPKNNENVALMVTKIVMQIEKLVIAKNKNNCKKAENSKN